MGKLTSYEDDFAFFEHLKEFVLLSRSHIQTFLPAREKQQYCLLAQACSKIQIGTICFNSAM